MGITQKYHIKNQQLKYYLLAPYPSSNDSQLHSSINNSQSPHTVTSPSSIHVSLTPSTLSPTPPPLPKPIYDINTCNCVCREEIDLLKEQIQHIEASLLIFLEQNTIINSIPPFTNLMNAHVPHHLSSTNLTDLPQRPISQPNSIHTNSSTNLTDLLQQPISQPT